MRVKMKNRSHRFDINIIRSRHSYEYIKYVPQYDDGYVQ